MHKKLKRLMKQSESEAKPTHCILCKQPQSSFCKSHLIPKMILKNISDNGNLLHANAFFGLETLDIEKGINNAGVFYYICRKCDGTIFRDYEDPITLCQKPTDKIMAEIALKNVLLLLSKRNNEISLYNLLQSKHNRIIGKDVLDKVHNLDIRDYMSQLDLYQKIIRNNETGGFQILYWKKLPFVVPIAVQTPITLYKDMNNNIINDTYNLSPTIRMQDLHLCIFPLEHESIILAFYHKRDKNYRPLRHQFNCSSEEKCLEFLNYLVFEYTENYFCSKNTKEIIENNPSLRKVSQESNGKPHLGYLSASDVFTPYKPVMPNEIPNFLTEQYKIR